MKVVTILTLLCIVLLSVESVVVPLRRKNVPAAVHKASKAYLRDVSLRRQFVDRANVPIHGNYSVAIYFAQLNIGTPPQKSEVQLDTGSSDYAVYTAGCAGCSPSTQFYYPSRSSSLANIDCGGNGGQFQCPACNNSQCAYLDRYGDGSHIGGRVALETFTLPTPSGSVSASGVSFGMIQSASPNFESAGSDGIWGLAFSVLSAWHGKTVFEQLAVQNGWQDLFGLCLQNNAGFFLPDEPAPSATSWTPLTGETYYSVQVTDLKVAGTSIGLSQATINAGGSIVDSGTTLIVASGTIYNAWTGAIAAMCQQGASLVGVCNAQSGQTIFDGYCFSMTDAEVSAYPTLQVSMQDAGDMDVDPTTYLQKAVMNGNEYRCFAMANGGSAGLGFILGDTFMANYRVTFDRTNKRVGFSPVETCP